MASNQKTLHHHQRAVEEGKGQEGFMSIQENDSLTNFVSQTERKSKVILKKPTLPKEIAPGDLPHTFKFIGNGKTYRIIITPKNGLQMLCPY
jgi:hypothetical protein